MAARDLIAELARIVGDRHVRTDPDDLAGVVVDWTGRYRGDADALVRPGDVAQTAAIVSTCRRAGVPVYTQGGNTGMVAGAVPHRPGIVLATSRLDQVGTVDHGQLEAGAGATLAAVGAAAREAGWRYPVDLAARDTATIGGTVATNAGGVHVVRHGMTRAHVVGIECITGTGAVLRDMRGLAKDNTGYHLPSLLCGSEGTLAVITAARLRLVPPEPDQATALVPVADNADAVDLGLRLARLPDIAAVEYVRADGCDLVARHLGRPSPLAGAAAGLVVEVEGPDGVIDRLAAVLDDRNALVASSRLDRQRLWQWRERHSEVLATLGTVHKLDVTVPARHLRR
ncbi:MAG: FAD-binding oxidoreductase, partial [Acidimicrobiia bacterium]|nr:FAD-binding oxidoreductase [Acidimicrobiia bacterium]